MEFMICGSMHFAKEMLEAQKTLQALGHTARVPSDIHECLDNPELNMDFDYCVRTNIDKKDFQQVADSEAILVLNYPKQGIEGYVGGATLMEIGLARGKKLYDKRDAIAKRESEREMQRATKSRVRE